ncbi:MAG: ATP-grasp domain-containing protein [Pseudomonadota bacterium]
MQWILQNFEDTEKLAAALERLQIPYSLHTVVPFVGDLIPRPKVDDPNKVMLIGSYAMWRYAQANGLRPGVFTLRPFVFEEPWQPFMLNGPNAVFLKVSEIPERLHGDGSWFVRPVSDNKEHPGRVSSVAQIRDVAQSVLSLGEQETPPGSLRHDTRLMLTPPATIYKEWRLWIVADEVVTYSLYKEGTRVIYKADVDTDVLEFTRRLVALNPAFAPAYVIDVCRTDDGLRLLETNCINAAGFYAANLFKLAASMDALSVAP